MALARTFKELNVWQNAMDAAMIVYELTKSLPRDERFSMCDQVRRASRSVAANISEGWRKRRYVAAFCSKLNDSEAEAAEVQTWIEFGLRCRFWSAEAVKELDDRYEEILRQLANMIEDADSWCAGLKR